MPTKLSPTIRKKLLLAQESEITEHNIYKRLAKATKDKANAKILKQISDDELKHYNFWKTFTKKDVPPNKMELEKYYWITRLLGLTFGIKLMEKGEENAQVNYQEFIKLSPKVKDVIADENKHEKALIKCINEAKLEHIRSIVLGLNDALVEITGTLAGLSFALQDTRLVGIAGLITGIAASLSMAASEYLSNRAEGNTTNALTSSIYTGIAYIITVVLMIAPYFIFESYITALFTTLIIVISIIAIFNFYLSVAKDYNFKKRFFEMAGISLGVAFLSFIIGILVRLFRNIDV